MVLKRLFGKKNREKAKIKSLNETINSPTIGRSASNKKQKAKQELNEMGHLTDKQKADKDRQDRRKYDQEHLVYNKRGRLIKTKEGYDPSKGVQKNTTKSTSKTKPTSKTKSTSKKDSLAGIKSAAASRHADWKKMRSGSMSKADFIAKHPDSVTARTSKKKKSPFKKDRR